MGACFISFNLPGTLSKDEVRSKYADRQERDRHEHGTDGYNGTFSTLHAGIAFPTDKVFDTVAEAETYLDENCDKWDVAKAVKAKDVRKVQAKEPTFDGTKPGYMHGGFCSFKVMGARKPDTTNPEDRVWTYGTPQNCYPADQLGERDKAKVLKLYEAYKETRNAAGLVKVEYDKLVNAFAKLEDEFTDYKGLKAIRGKYAKAKAKADATEKALREFDASLKDKLYATKDDDKGIVWVIGGCAAM